MCSILFNAGACPCTIPAISLSPSSSGCKFLGPKDHYERSSGPIFPRYSKKVLHGNWVEERAVHHPSCVEWITAYSADYKPLEVKDYSEDQLTNWKIKFRVQGVEAKLVSDGDQYFHNMTTTYDLSYRILPKNMCGTLPKTFNSSKNEWVPETELIVSHGSQTKYGLAEAIREEHRLAELIPAWQSRYQADYNERPITTQHFPGKRFCMPHGDMTTPDLRHLKIVLSPTPRRTVQEAQYYRLSPCEKNYYDLTDIKRYDRSANIKTRHDRNKYITNLRV